MMQNDKNMMFREMMLDICYRLRLADDLFCCAADILTGAMASDHFSLKKDAVNHIHRYSLALQIIHVDLCRLVEMRRIVFPQDFALWIWDEPDAEMKITLHLERLQSIGQGLEMSANAEMLKLEVKR